MVKSNINITSNIYVRSTDDIIYDKKYTEKITGAERLKNIKKEYKGLKSIRLTEIQDKIVSESTLCMYAENGEKSYGPVKYKDGLRWVNRCEYTDCPGYESEPCTSNRDSEFIARRPVSKDDLEEEISLEERLKEFGITIQDDTVIFERDKNIAEVEIAPKEYSAPKEMNTSQIEQESIPYEKINTPDCIISAPLDSHIILNSGPGTGKTYTIIQRLIYILDRPSYY